MIVAEKPPLNEELLIHFGIRGMRWGHRKKRPDEAERKKIFSKQNVKRAAVGAVLLGGAAATIYMLSKRGGTKVADLKPPVSFNRAAPLPKLSPPQAFRPAPSFMRSPGVAPTSFRNDIYAQRARHLAAVEAGKQSHARTMQRLGLNRLTDKTWRDEAKLNTMVRDMKNRPDPLAEIRKQLADPNHVWEI